MNKTRLTQLIFCLFALFSSIAFAAKQDKRIFVSIAPYKMMVEQLLDKQYPVEVLVSHGSSPETYDPAPEQFKKLMQARLYFSIGLPIEKRLEQKLSSTNQQLIWISLNSEYTPQAHEHHHHGEHHQDIHSWLDPILVKQQIEHMAKHLTQAFPELNATIRKNKQDLLQKTQQLHQKITHFLSNDAKHKFLIYHPGLSFFAKRYGLKQISIEQDGKTPSTQTFVRLIKFLKQQQAKHLLFENNNHTRTINNIAERLELEKLPIDLLAQDYFNNLWHIATQVKKASF